jgi:hypothetical protein
MAAVGASSNKRPSRSALFLSTSAMAATHRLLVKSMDGASRESHTAVTTTVIIMVSSLSSLIRASSSSLVEKLCFGILVDPSNEATMGRLLGVTRGPLPCRLRETLLLRKLTRKVHVLVEVPNFYGDLRAVATGVTVVMPAESVTSQPSLFVT